MTNDSLGAPDSSGPDTEVRCSGEEQTAPPEIGARTLMLYSYDVPRAFYRAGWGESRCRRSAAVCINRLGSIIWYGDKYPHTGRNKRIAMDIDAMVAQWRKMIVGLALAHDKDEADRHEATVDECLTPILTAPIAQVRELGVKLLATLKADPQVPFLVWRSYEVWVERMVASAPDEGVKDLKMKLAREISDMVEQDVKDQLPEAIVRAMQWRSPETLDKFKRTVEEEKAARPENPAARARKLPVYRSWRHGGGTGGVCAALNNRPPGLHPPEPSPEARIQQKENG